MTMPLPTPSQDQVRQLQAEYQQRLLQRRTMEVQKEQFERESADNDRRMRVLEAFFEGTQSGANVAAEQAAQTAADQAAEKAAADQKAMDEKLQFEASDKPS